MEGHATAFRCRLKYGLKGSHLCLVLFGYKFCYLLFNPLIQKTVEEYLFFIVLKGEESNIPGIPVVLEEEKSHSADEILIFTKALPEFPRALFGKIDIACLEHNASDA